MIELEIKKIDGSCFTLMDKKGRRFEVVLEFQTEKQPKVGDSLLMNEALFNPHFQKHAKFYAFGEMDSEYGRQIVSDLDVDLIGFFDGKEKKVFKRIYG